MIRPGMVWGVARSEARLCRRLVRYWVFQLLATVIGIFFFLQYFFIHYQFSSWSGTAALLNPRYLISAVGMYYLIGFLFGLVFMGFDVRARDNRERMVEVVDALPCTNLELLLGKFVGILLPSWIPVVLIAVVLGALSAALGQPIQILSLISFVIMMAIPAYCFVLGLTFLLTLLLRHRLLAGIAVCGVLVAIVVINMGFVPIYLLPMVDITGVFSLPWASDLIPQIVDARGAVQRIAVVLASLALLCFAAVVHPRRDDSSRGALAATAVALLLVAAGMCGWGVLETKSVIRQKAEWKAAHEARSKDPAPDLLAVSGFVGLRPPKELSMDLSLRFRAPDDTALDTALFSLNPGLAVSAARDDGGRELAFEHENGLLEIELPDRLPPGAETTVELEIRGLPDLFFAYLDSVFDPLTMSIRDGNIFMLGFFNYLYDRRYVALMPGVRWLPAAGAEIGRGDPEVRPPDFFTVDLTVEAPEGWLVAGPGRRLEVDGQAGRFRFAPSAPMPEVAILASRFESRSTEIEGVTLEVLVHRKHVSSIEFFEDAATEIRDWLDERLREADELGLTYPYDALTLVEVPGALRGFGGGWRMDSTMMQPALVLMRESGFPTANFNSRFKNESQFESREGGLPRAKREALERFFENDFTGGNPFVAAAKNFFGYQTSGKGDEGLPLNFVCQNLATELVTEKNGYFSVHLMGEDMGQAIQRSLRAIFTSQGEDMAGAIIHAMASRGEVWDKLLGVSLTDLDPWEDPEQAIDVLTLKGGAMAESMLDGLGRDSTGRMLADLRTRAVGGTFGSDEVVAAGRDVGEDLQPWMETWLHHTDLPGFLLGDVVYHRLQDSDDGSPRYQMLVTVRNDEETPGMVRLEYSAGRESGDRDVGKSDPVRVGPREAVQIGLVTSSPLESVRVAPYLALNRDPFNVPLPALDEEKMVDDEPFVGSRDTEWTAPSEGVVTVDDLDDGFSVEEGEGREMWRLGGRDEDVEMDGGLPVAQFGLQGARHWSRMSMGGAYGKYRHTTAIVRPGKGERLAVFTAEIPGSGEWELEFYLPSRSTRGPRTRSPGEWSLTVTDESESRQLNFNADEGDPGWNSLGVFDITEGEVRVAVSDKTEGSFVMADAIRWTPVGKPGS